jgi:hypothetical protein
MMITLTGHDNFLHRIRGAAQLVRSGSFSTLSTEIKKQLGSESLAFGLRRDLDIPFKPPKAKINISVRQLEPTDLASLLHNTSNNPDETRGISDQRGIVKAKIPDCYVAVTDDNIPCYMQWLISSQYNHRISDYFHGLFPSLTNPEALLEGAYTPPAFRGLGIMPAAMALIATRASSFNAHLVNTFVDVNNIASLKGCRRAGFSPYILRKDKWLLFHRTISFHPIPDNLLESYHLSTAEKPAKVNS